MDKGRSRLHGDHRRGKGQLLAFLKGIKRRRIAPGSVLIIENLDRLSREEMDEAHDLFKSILKSGIWIATEMPERIYTPESLKTLLGTIEPLLHMYVAQEQSKKLSERIRDKWDRRRERARESKQPHGRCCPSWLKLTSDGYEVIPCRAATVRKIYQLTREGLGVHRIVAWLNEHPKDHPPFALCGRWSLQYVRKILHGRSVLGEYHPHFGRRGRNRKPEGDPIPGYYSPIVDEDEWRAAQISITGRRGKSGRCGHCEANLFTGIVFEVRSRLPMSIIHQIQFVEDLQVSRPVPAAKR